MAAKVITAIDAESAALIRVHCLYAGAAPPHHIHIEATCHMQSRADDSNGKTARKTEEAKIKDDQRRKADKRKGK